MANKKIIIDVKKAEMNFMSTSMLKNVTKFTIPCDKIQYMQSYENGGLRIVMDDKNGFFYIGNKEVAESIYKQYTSNS